MYSKNNNDKAISYFIKSIEIYKSINREAKTTQLLNNLSNIYSNQGRYLDAIECLKKCLYINEKLKRDDEIPVNLVNIGLLYAEIDLQKKGITFIEKAITKFKKLDKKYELSLCYLNIGNLYEQDLKYKIAEEYYKKGIKISEGIKDNNLLYYSHSNIAHLYHLLKKYDASLKNYKKSLSIVDSLNDNFLNCELYLKVSELYSDLNALEKAFEFVLKAQKIANKHHLTQKQKEAHEILSKLYKKRGNYKKAYENHIKFKTLSDSLFNKETIQKISQIEAEYKYKQEKEDANKRELKLTEKVKITTKNLESSQRVFFIGIIIFLLTSIFLLAGISILKVRNIRVKNENILTEQKLLRSQMTPHFIFNSLAVLQGIILNKEEKKSVSYLTRFSKLLRLILENSRDSIVPLFNELKAIENYITLQNIHDTYNPFEFTISVDKKINQHKINVPPMLIQPFIENAIEHAFKKEQENKRITINLSYENTDLICIIEDNGIGINAYKKENNRKKKSLATIITSERLELLSKKYKTNGSLSIKNCKKNNKTGTIVKLTIPYKII